MNQKFLSEYDRKDDLLMENQCIYTEASSSRCSFHCYNVPQGTAIGVSGPVHTDIRDAKSYIIAKAFLDSSFFNICLVEEDEARGSSSSKLAECDVHHT